MVRRHFLALLAASPLAAVLPKPDPVDAAEGLEVRQVRMFSDYEEGYVLASNGRMLPYVRIDDHVTLCGCEGHRGQTFHGFPPQATIDALADLYGRWL